MDLKISDEIRNRKGARKPAEVPAEVLELLNSGLLETVNLSEWLAVDQLALLQHFMQDHGMASSAYERIYTAYQQLKKQTVNTVNQLIGQELQRLLADEAPDRQARLYEQMSHHVSDIVRGWAAYVVSFQSDWSLEKQLEAVRPFAADAHFGVRELAWFAMRPPMALELTKAIGIMEEWAKSDDENIRRFATESLRPRGVWCAHIEELKEQPHLAVGILEPLKNDPSKYVRDSVGNWLNDASKSAPDWVEDLCERWGSESDTKATNYIIKRALRTLRK